jgi:Skp family chaperone for outer membrane proteins
MCSGTSLRKEYHMKAHGFMARTGLIALLLSVAIAFPGLCKAAEQKMGKVDLRRIYSTSTTVKKATDQLRQMGADAGAKESKIGDEIRQIEAKLKKGSLKEEEKKALQGNLGVKKEELETERQTARVKMAFKRKSLQNTFKLKMEQIIKSVASAKGVNLVVTQDAIVWSEDVPDLTADVIKKLDGPAAPAAPAAPAKMKKEKKEKK